MCRRNCRDLAIDERRCSAVILETGTLLSVPLGRGLIVREYREGLTNDTMQVLFEGRSSRTRRQS